MKAKRAPKVLKSKGASSSEMKHEHISIRKIANGYLVHHSSHDGEGKMIESEHYMPERPKIEMPKVPKGKKDAD